MRKERAALGKARGSQGDGRESYRNAGLTALALSTHIFSYQPFIPAQRCSNPSSISPFTTPYAASPQRRALGSFMPVPSSGPAEQTWEFRGLIRIAATVQGGRAEMHSVLTCWMLEGEVQQQLDLQ